MRKLTATKQIHTRTKKTKGQERGEALTCHWSCRYRTNGQERGEAPLMPLVPPQDTAMPLLACKPAIRDHKLKHDHSHLCTVAPF